LLITVSGVGPKVALSVLCAENTDLIKSAIANQDVAVFTKIGGVGKKTAEKIILELKDKIGAVEGGTMPRGSSDEVCQHLRTSVIQIKKLKTYL